MLLDVHDDSIGKLVEMVLSSSDDESLYDGMDYSTSLRPSCPLSFDMSIPNSNGAPSLLDASPGNQDQYDYQQSPLQSIAPSLILAPSPFAAINQGDPTICTASANMVVDDEDCCDDDDDDNKLQAHMPIDESDLITTPYDGHNNEDEELVPTNDGWRDLDAMLDDAFNDYDSNSDTISTNRFFSSTQKSGFSNNCRITPITISVTAPLADYDRDVNEDDDDDEITNLILQPRIPLTRAKERERNYHQSLAEWERAEEMKPKLANYWKAIGAKNKATATVVPVHANRKPASVTFAYNLCRIRRFSWREEPTRLQPEEVVEDKSLKGFDDIADVLIRCQPAFSVAKPRPTLARKEGPLLRKAVVSKEVIDNAYSVWKECMGTVCDELVCSSVVLRKEKAVSFAKSNKSTSPRKDGHLVGNYQVFRPSPLRQFMVVDDDDEEVTRMDEDHDTCTIPDLLAVDKEISPPVLKRKRSSTDCLLPDPLSPTSSASTSEENEDCDAVASKRQRPQVVKLVDPNGKCKKNKKSPSEAVGLDVTTSARTTHSQLQIEFMGGPRFFIIVILLFQLFHHGFTDLKDPDCFPA
ncbi:hypothetical protein SeMB42_g07799 [Synchytrium endobioticum]|uniref:Uncharacterized protein n=1 Tax=Synchytrium endobioticum TaxID=286115 RepID=A0A507BVN3_9FUNG|nr:hypothetical protein SeMB42_g07799 [Synchytrium endobioticum]